VVASKALEKILCGSPGREAGRLSVVKPIPRMKGTAADHQRCWAASRRVDARSANLLTGPV
jgi:hypothetical protein